MSTKTRETILRVLRARGECTVNELAAEAGVNAYIVKPFEYTTLRKKIIEILGLHGGLKSLPGADGMGRAAEVPLGGRLAGL